MGKKQATRSGGEVRNKLFESHGGQWQPPITSRVFLFPLLSFPPFFERPAGAWGACGARFSTIPVLLFDRPIKD
jgi:hypothetical protein